MNEITLAAGLRGGKEYRAPYKRGFSIYASPLTDAYMVFVDDPYDELGEGLNTPIKWTDDAREAAAFAMMHAADWDEVHDDD